MRYVVSAGGADLTVEIASDGVTPRLLADGPDADVQLVRAGLFSVCIGGRSHEVAIEILGTEQPVEVMATVDGVSTRLTIQDERRHLMRHLAAGPAAMGQSAAVTVAAPMPGRIVAVPVEAGATVERGQTVVVLEAMKMESALAAPSGGTVTEILITAGQAVQQRQALLRIQPGSA